MRQLLEATLELHKNHIVHRDIKAENVLIHKNRSKVYLLDFNVSKVQDSGCQLLTSTGTPYNRAPEMVNR